MGRRTNLILPDELVREVDRVAGPRNRSRFVADAVRDRLRRERLREAWGASFGALRRDEHPEWATPDRVAAWVRDLRADERPGEDRGPADGASTDPGGPDRTSVGADPSSGSGHARAAGGRRAPAG